MQELTNGLPELLTAQELLENTITNEEKFARDKANVLDSLMSSMVGVATKDGKKEYSASINPNFDPTLYVSVKNQLQDLGYKLSETTQDIKDIGAVVVLNISWDLDETSTTTESN